MIIYHSSLTELYSQSLQAHSGGDRMKLGLMRSPHTSTSFAPGSRRTKNHLEYSHKNQPKCCRVVPLLTEKSQSVCDSRVESLCMGEGGRFFGGEEVGGVAGQTPSPSSV